MTGILLCCHVNPDLSPAWERPTKWPPTEGLGAAKKNGPQKEQEEPCRSGGGVRTGRSPLHPGTVGKLGPDKKLKNTFEVLQEDDNVDGESAVDGAETAAGKSHAIPGWGVTRERSHILSEDNFEHATC